MCRRMVHFKKLVGHIYDVPIRCTEDIAMPPGEFAWPPRFPARLGLCRLVQMPGAHSPVGQVSSQALTRSSQSSGGFPRSSMRENTA